MRRFSVLLSLFLMAGSVWSQTAMPDWFWVPKGPGWTEVFARSAKSAITSAATVLSAHVQTRVVGRFQQLYDTGIDARTWINSDYTYDYNGPAAKKLEAILEVKDSYTLHIFTGLKVYLVGPKTAGKIKARSVLTATKLPKPWWSEQSSFTEPGTGRAWAVGRFSLEGNPGDAWLKAEELAVFELVVSDRLNLAQATEASQNNGVDRFAQLEWISLDTELADVLVEGRWVDPATGDALVAVSVPLASIRAME